MTGTPREQRANGAPAPEGLRWDAEEDGYSLLPFRLLAPLQWRDHAEEGYVELHRAPRGEWRKVRDYYAPVLEGIARGEQLPQLARTAAEAMPHRPAAHIPYILRNVTRRLVRWGMAEVITPPPPERFNDRYEVLGELGRGGMGVLWRCRDLEAGEEVAVKHAWNWSGAFHRREKHLREEAEMMARFDHAGIVAARDAFEHEGRFHLVRDLVAGPGVEDLRAAADPAERARVLRGMIDALAHMLERGYFCLDVKTGNFMLDGEGGPVRLMDLGLCRPLEAGRVRVGRGVPGTRSYAAPELLREEWADERALVYALGRVHWRLATGKKPRARAHYESYFEQHETDLEALGASDATRAERHLIARCTDPRPERRPPTLAALREELG